MTEQAHAGRERRSGSALLLTGSVRCKTEQRRWRSGKVADGWGCTSESRGSQSGRICKLSTALMNEWCFFSIALTTVFPQRGGHCAGCIRSTRATPFLCSAKIASGSHCIAYLMGIHTVKVYFGLIFFFLPIRRDYRFVRKNAQPFNETVRVF